MAIKTGVKCNRPGCKGEILAEVEETPLGSDMCVGPGSAHWNRSSTRISYFCNNKDCGQAFHHPPGMPKADESILQKYYDGEDEVDC